MIVEYNLNFSLMAGLSANEQMLCLCTDSITALLMQLQNGSQQLKNTDRIFPGSTSSFCAVLFAVLLIGAVARFIYFPFF